MSFALLPTVALSLVTAFAVVALTFGGRRGRFSGPLRAMARRPALAIGISGLLGSAHAAALNLWNDPTPRMHDEFAYLLAADTFASGRATNPIPPCPDHLETFHVIVSPTYMAKYPPGQGLSLALGQICFGRPIAGVCLGLGFMAASGCWLFRVVMPARWAFVGGLLLGMWPAVLFGHDYGWALTFWGGGLAAGFGALTTGGAVRIVRHGGPASAWTLLGIGLAGLANTRPFEGLLMALPIGIGLACWLYRRGMQQVWRAWPIVVVLVPTFAAMAWYNQTVTGSPTTLPYMLHEKAYSVAPSFLFSSPRSIPDYGANPLRAKFHIGREMDEEYLPQRTVDGWVQKSLNKLKLEGLFYLAPIGLLLPLGVLRWRSRWVGWSFAVGCLLTAGQTASVWSQPHYLAPVFGALLLIVISAMRFLKTGGRRGRTYLGLALLVYAMNFAQLGRATYFARDTDWSVRRQWFANALQKRDGNHLVFMHYPENHPAAQEWVYNRADPTTAKIVWLRSLGAVRDHEALQAYPNRTVWSVYPDPVLQPQIWLGSTIAPGRPVDFVVGSE